MRGFISGLIWGVVFMGIGVAALSLLVPREASVTAPDATVGDSTADSAAPDISDAQDAQPPVAEDDTPASTPEAGSDPAPERTPDAAADSGRESGAEPEAEAPQTGQPADPDPMPQEVQPQEVQPQGDPAEGASTDSLTPEAPPEQAAAPGTAPVAPDVDATAPTAPQTTDAQSAEAQGAPSAAQAPEPLARPRTVTQAPGFDTTPQAPDTMPEIGAPAELDPEPEPQDDTAPQVAGLPQAGTAQTGLRPTIGTPVVPLTERNTAAASETTPQASVPPLLRYASPFDNSDDKPLMAIVLIDDERSVGVEALRDFPYPLTFAVNPEAEDARAKMTRHRAAGFEVVALVDLPRLATAQDAEVALAAGFEQMQEAIAILEGTGTGVQGNRDLSDQVTAFVGSTGRGLITQGNGLNTVQKLATRSGVPAAAVFRDFDGDGQSPDVMRRFLDQAAFRAGQEGAVIMMGRVRPDTISALLLWGLQDRSSRVALAPVSAVLQGTVAAR